MAQIRIKLKELYESKGITQKEVSRKSGLRESTLSQYARNYTSSISLSTLAALIEFFELDSMDEILEIVPDEQLKVRGENK